MRKRIYEKFTHASPKWHSHAKKEGLHRLIPAREMLTIPAQIRIRARIHACRNRPDRTRLQALLEPLL